MDARIYPTGICPKGLCNEAPFWYMQRNHRHFDCPIKWETAASLATDADKVIKHAFLPFVRFDIKTRKSIYVDDVVSFQIKNRVICMPSHKDSHIYAYYSSLLSDSYENHIRGVLSSESAVAYRKLGGKSNIDYAYEVFEEVKTRANCSVFTFDVTDFFGSLKHDVLKKMWRVVLQKEQLPLDHYKVFRSITAYSSVGIDDIQRALELSKTQFRKRRPRLCSELEFKQKIRAEGLIKTHKEKVGIPQGSPISALLYDRIR